MFVCLFVRFIFAVILRAGDRWTTRVCSREASLRPRLSLNPGCQMFVLVRARTPRVYAAARGVHAARALSVRSPRTALEGSVRVHRVYIVYISSGGKLRCVESNSMVENVPVCVRVCECVGISMCMLIYVYVYVCGVRLCVRACVRAYAHTKTCHHDSDGCYLRRSFKSRQFRCGNSLRVIYA